MPSPYIAPLGGMSLTIDAVANTFAMTPTWQTWTRADLVTSGTPFQAALNRVHIYSLPEPEGSTYTREELEGMRPVVGLSYIPPAFGNRSADSYYRSRNALESFTERATIFANIIDDVSEFDTEDTSYLVKKYTNNLGLLIDDLLRTGDEDGAAYIRGISVVYEPSRVDRVQRETTGNFIQSMLRIDVGVG